MIKSIFDILPNPEALLALEPEELAGVVLEYLNSVDEKTSSDLNRHNFSLPHIVQDYPAKIVTVPFNLIHSRPYPLKKRLPFPSLSASGSCIQVSGSPARC